MSLQKKYGKHNVPSYQCYCNYLQYSSRICIPLYCSIISQDYLNFEIVIVDDESEGLYWEPIIQKYGNNKSVSCIRSQHNGISASRNIGINMAHGQYLTFVDGDDWIEPNMLTKTVDCLFRYKVDMVQFTYFEHFNGKTLEDTFFTRDMHLTDKVSIGKALIHKLPLPNEQFCYPVFLHGAWGFLIKTEVAKEVLYDVDVCIGEDNEFNSRLFRSLNSIYYLHIPLYHYRCWRNSLSHSASQIQFIPSMQKITYNLMAYPQFTDSKNYLFCLLFFSTSYARHSD